jgi:hypothetical protein
VLVSLTVTGDGFLLGMALGDVGHNHFLGTKADLYRDLEGASEAGLTAAEKEKRLSLCP